MTEKNDISNQLSTKQKFRLNVVLSAKKIGQVETSRIFNLSRQTISRWMKNYNKVGISGLENRSRKHLEHPNKMPKDIEEKIISYKKSNPQASATTIKKQLNLKYTIKIIMKKLKDNNLIVKKKVKFSENKVSKDLNDLNKANNHYDEDSIINTSFSKFYFTIERTEKFENFDFPQYVLTLIDPFTETVFLGYSDYNDDFSIASYLSYFFKLFDHNTTSLGLSNANERVKIIPLKKMIINYYKKEKSFLFELMKRSNFEFIDSIDQKEFNQNKNLFRKTEIRKWIRKDYIFSDINTFLQDVNEKICLTNFNAISDKSRLYIDLEKRNYLQYIFQTPVIYIGKEPTEKVFRKVLLNSINSYNNNSFLEKILNIANTNFSFLLEKAKVKAEYFRDRFNYRNSLIYYNLLLSLNINGGHIHNKDLHLELILKLEIEKIKIIQGRISDSEQEIKCIIQKSNKLGYKDIELEAYREISQINLQSGLFKKAKNYLNKARELAIYLDVKETILDIQINFGDIFNGTGNKKEAKKIYLETYRTASKLKIGPLKIKALINLITVYDNMGRTKTAKSLLEYSESLAEKNGCFDSLLKIYSICIPFFTNHFDKNELKSYIIKIKENIPKVQHTLDSLLESWNKIAFAEISIGNYEESTIYLSKVLVRAEESDLFYKSCTALQNIGVQYYFRKKHLMAVKYYKKAIKIAEENNIINVIIIANLNIAKTLYINNKDDEALKHTRISLDAAVKVQNNLNITDCLYTQAQIYCRMRDYKRASELNKKVFKLSREYDQIIFIACAHSIEGVINTARNRYSLARKDFDTAIKLITGKNKDFYLSNFLYHYAFLQNISNNYEEALKLVTEAIKIADPLGYFHIVKSGNSLKNKILKRIN